MISTLKVSITYLNSMAKKISLIIHFEADFFSKEFVNSFSMTHRAISLHLRVILLKYQCLVTIELSCNLIKRVQF